MKSKNLIIATVSLSVLSAVFIFSPFSFFNKKGEYNPSNLTSLQQKSATDARIWLDARYVDLETGEKITPEKLQQLYNQEKSRKRSSIVFEELGPDNIGGRTRAIVIDREYQNLLWAGSVSGGLFVSYNGANTWQRVDEFPGLPYISSMTQTPNKTVFVATGMSVSGSDTWGGNGLYYKTVNSDEWALVPGTASFSVIEEVISSDVGNTVFFATNSGVKKWTVGDATISNVTITSGPCTAIQISKDGQVIVAAVGSLNKVYVSTDGGQTFSDRSGVIGEFKVPVGSPRIEFAISHTKNSSNNYSIYASRTGSDLLGMHVSHDNGQTWHRFVGASGSPSNLDIYRNQGLYNSVLTVSPLNTERILIGGIDVWEWKQQVDNPPSGGFEQLSLWSLNPTSQAYVHADNHEFKWTAYNRLYIGNDGGVGVSDDFGATFYPANRGYNVTQFYGIAMDRNGSVMGGTQDNGTLYNDFSNVSYKEFTEVRGGDGFECEISFFNPNVMFSSVYYNAISRSGDRGLTFGSFAPNFPSNYGPVGTSSAAHPFHTEFVMAEYFDNNSQDKVTFMPKKDYPAGSFLKVPSLATGDTINYQTPIALYYDDTVFADPSLTRTDYKVVNGLNGFTIDLGQNSYTTLFNASGPVDPPAVGDTLLVNGTTKVFVSQVTPYQHYFAKNPATNEKLDLREEQLGFNVSWDTIQVKDPFQSWFMVYTRMNGGEIWATRDALRLSSNPTWARIATGLGQGSVDIEFSKDLNHCFISCGARVYRIDGLGSIYSQSPTFSEDAVAAGTAKVQISTMNCEGIAVNPNNPNDLLLLQGFSGNVLRSNNATAASPTFTNLTSLGIGAYDGIIDRNNPQILVIGTAFGVKVSTNGGNTWEDASAGFNDVPVFEVRQNWRTWEEGCKRPGEIYLGTFGRGIWASSDLANLTDKKESSVYKTLNTNLKVYPNPTVNDTKLSFNMLKNGNVSIRVYNLAGVEVRNLVFKNMNEGQQTIDIDVENLPRGTYLVKFNSGDINEAVKFIKM
jgi:hypothetical protein